MDSRKQLEEYRFQQNAYLTQNSMNTHWIIGSVNTIIGSVHQISTILTREDKMGELKVRLGINRDNYRIVPGLYAIGRPDEASPVFVSANYKLSFDMLRKELEGMNAWLIFLDTKGINVWCAAGKGTFGTEEVIGRVNFLKLRRIVSHKTLILPQLSAPGVAAHEVAKKTGFKVIYGPVRAEDIPAFMANGMKATPEMRTVNFTLKDRAILTPVELMHSIKILLGILLALLVLNLISPSFTGFIDVLSKTLLNFAPYLIAVLLGCVAVPILLPWLPFRSFALKGCLVGLVWAVFVSIVPARFGFSAYDGPQLGANLLILPAITAYFALNFTGSSTYTSFTGVKLETRRTLITASFSVGLGAILIILSKVFAFWGWGGI